jgi:flagellar biosynthesis regulator FlaF
MSQLKDRQRMKILPCSALFSQAINRLDEAYPHWRAIYFTRLLIKVIISPQTHPEQYFAKYLATP